jgi:hypothetical protein
VSEVEARHPARPKSTAMTSTIGSRSIQYQSIFSSSESYLSTNTEWTFNPSIGFGDGSDTIKGDGKHKPIRQKGRPPNGWTSRSLRKLIRLYLLTDLELDSIIDRLRTEDFQPWWAQLLPFDPHCVIQMS